MYKRVFGYKKQISLKLLGFTRKINRKRKGVNLIGFFSHTLGVAEIGRFFARRMIDSQIPFTIFDIELSGYAKLDNHSLGQFKGYYSEKTKYYKNIFFINADTINHIQARHPEKFLSRYNAAVFFWEFDDYFFFPQAFTFLDEVITFTEFIATAVRKAAPKHIKVTHLPIPFVRSWQITQSKNEIKERFGIGFDEFLFIFNFDFLSVYNRKNPEAILTAFDLAFNDNDKVRLILKTLHGEETNIQFQRLLDVVEEMKIKHRVLIINQNMVRDEFMSMINASDCYISLHRSEGLGLGMMEAMSMGKPVIATGYGGNTDFMNDDNSLLVNYTLVPVEPGSAPYKPGWLWANADVSTAAEYMKRLYENKTFAEDLGKRAQQYIDTHYNKELFAEVLAKWMKADS